MPHANVFDGGDGLNTAVSQWVRRGHSSGAFALANGTDTNADRKQINVKVDHNFNQNHKVAVNYSYEWIDADNLPERRRECVARLLPSTACSAPEGSHGQRDFNPVRSYVE
jgi:predicted porin